jgi:hypothetical protein
MTVAFANPCRTDRIFGLPTFEQAKIDFLQVGRGSCSHIRSPSSLQSNRKSVYIWNIRIWISISWCTLIFLDLSYSRHAPAGKGAQNKVRRYFVKRMTRTFIPYPPIGIGFAFDANCVGIRQGLELGFRR